MSRRGDKTNQRVRNSILDVHLELKKENKKKTREELGEDERFEDHPHADRDKDIGRVKKKPTSMTYAMKKGDVFDD
tara:strand:- start:541 stop:768 length:228 start_codon:yes stop_codon:yes gene_type:complete